MVRLNYEDLALYKKWVLDIISLHCGIPRHLSLIEVKHHVRMEGYEVDFVIKCKENVKVKTIIVELKDTDLPKVIKQALARRGLGDYVYVAINIAVHNLLEWMARIPEVEEAIARGIGIISTADNMVVVRARHHRIGGIAKVISLFTFLSNESEK